MAKLGISTGISPNDNTGDSLIVGAIKINSNFDEIYSYLGAGSTNVLSAPIWTLSSSGIGTLSNVGVGSTNPTSALTVSGDGLFTGIVTASTFSGTITNSNYANNSGISSYSSISGLSTSSTKVSIAETNLGNNSIILSSGATLGDNTLYIDSNLFYNASTNTLFADNFSGTSTYANIAGISTVSEGLTGNPNINVGVITATSFVGDGSALSGILTSFLGIEVRDSGSVVGLAKTIDFGDNLNVSPISSGITTVTSIDVRYWSQTDVGISTLTNVGIGTTNPTEKLTVRGGDISVGVSTAHGIILTSPNGTQYRLIVDDSGNLSTVGL